MALQKSVVILIQVVIKSSLKGLSDEVRLVMGYLEKGVDAQAGQDFGSMEHGILAFRAECSGVVNPISKPVRYVKKIRDTYCQGTGKILKRG
jgi:hypothetical protein